MDLSRILNAPGPVAFSSSTEHQSRSREINCANSSVSSGSIASDVLDGPSAQYMPMECGNEPAEHTSPSVGDSLDQARPGSIPPFTAPNTGNYGVDSLPEASSSGDPVLESHSPSTPVIATRIGAPAVIGAIEDIIAKIAHSLGQKEELSIELKTTMSSATSRTPESGQRVAISKIRFPGRNAHEAWKFSTRYCRGSILVLSAVLTIAAAVLLRILELVHQALVENVVVSKRCVLFFDTALYPS